MHIVRSPSGVSWCNSPDRSCHLSSILSGLMISSLNPGTERHPSSKDASDSLFNILYSGLIKTLGSFLSSLKSITITRICLFT